jgi:hypothetical protein
VNLLVKSELDPVLVMPGVLKPEDEGLPNGVVEFGPVPGVVVSPVVAGGGLMAGLVVSGPGVAVGAGVGYVPIIPVPGGLPMMVPGVPEPGLVVGAGVVVPAAPPKETPEGVDAAPPTACPEVAGVFGPVLP